MAGEALVDLADVRAARERIGTDLRVTPVWRPASLAALTGRGVWAKAENTGTVVHVHECAGVAGVLRGARG